jgi:hypothetical protein
MLKKEYKFWAGVYKVKTFRTTYPGFLPLKILKNKRDGLDLVLRNINFANYDNASGASLWH